MVRVVSKVRWLLTRSLRISHNAFFSVSSNNVSESKCWFCFGSKQFYCLLYFPSGYFTAIFPFPFFISLLVAFLPEVVRPKHSQGSHSTPCLDGPRPWVSRGMMRLTRESQLWLSGSVPRISTTPAPFPAGLGFSPAISRSIPHMLSDRLHLWARFSLAIRDSDGVQTWHTTGLRRMNRLRAMVRLNILPTGRRSSSSSSNSSNSLNRNNSTSTRHHTEPNRSSTLHSISTSHFPRPSMPVA